MYRYNRWKPERENASSPESLEIRRCANKRRRLREEASYQYAIGNEEQARVLVNQAQPGVDPFDEPWTRPESSDGPDAP